MVLAVLAGCAVPGGIPNAYEGQHPLADTAVFIATDTRSATPSMGRIHYVDDRETDCHASGCPMLIRVKPGRHAFSLRYAGDMNRGAYKEALIRVEFDARPRHVYIARYTTEADQRVVAKIEDLGEKPAYIPGRSDRMSFDVSFQP